MKAVFVALALVAVAAATEVQLKGVPKITICSSPSAILKNVTYTVSPQNIVPGVMLNVTASGVLTQAVTDAKLVLTATFDGLPIFSKTMDPCNSKSAHFPCPVQPGPLHYDFSHTIPNLPISGQVSAKAILTSQPSGTQIGCVKVSVNI